MDKFDQREVRQRAEDEFRQEEFRRLVEAEKLRIHEERAQQSVAKRLLAWFPFAITINRRKK